MNRSRARASEIEDDGVILVRPDQFIAWRQRVRAADCESATAEVLSKIVQTSGHRRTTDVTP